MELDEIIEVAEAEYMEEAKQKYRRAIKQKIYAILMYAKQHDIDIPLRFIARKLGVDVKVVSSVAKDVKYIPNYIRMAKERFDLEEDTLRELFTNNNPMVVMAGLEYLFTDKTQIEAAEEYGVSSVAVRKFLNRVFGTSKKKKIFELGVEV